MTKPILPTPLPHHDPNRKNRSGAPQSQILTFQDLAYGGEGVARLRSGKIIFVPGALPGDVAQCKVTMERGGFARGRLVELITGSPDRIPPACPHADRCGGCQFWNLIPQREWKLKTGAALEAIRRISKLEELPLPVLHGPGSPRQYRRRLKLAFAANGAPGLREAGSHTIVPIPGCLVAKPCLLEAAQELTPLLKELGTGGQLLLEADARGERVAAVIEVPLPGRDRGGGKGLADRLFSRVREFMEGAGARAERESEGEGPVKGLMTSGIKLVLTGDEKVAGEREAAPRGKGRGRDSHRSRDRTRARAGEEGPLQVGAAGNPSFTVEVAGRRFTLEAGVFNQVNDQANTILVERVLHHTAPGPGDRVLDLYSGWGNFTYSIGASGAEVHAMELSPLSIRMGKKNLQANRDRITFHQINLDQGLPSMWSLKHHRAFGTVLLDPPRTGASPKLLNDVALLKPNKIIYVSCDPPTLGRDAARLHGAGYVMTSLEMVDMFPRTHHTECVAVFSPTG